MTGYDPAWQPTPEECELALDLLAGKKTCIYVAAPPVVRMGRLERCWHRIVRWLRGPDWEELGSRDGSQDHPFRTIREAMEEVEWCRSCLRRDGGSVHSGRMVEVMLAPGVYTESAVVSAPNVSMRVWTAREKAK